MTRSLPPEVWSSVATHCHKREDLARMALVARDLGSAAQFELVTRMETSYKEALAWMDALVDAWHKEARREETQSGGWGPVSAVCEFCYAHSYDKTAYAAALARHGLPPRADDDNEKGSRWMRQGAAVWLDDDDPTHGCYVGEKTRSGELACKADRHAYAAWRDFATFFGSGHGEPDEPVLPMRACGYCVTLAAASAGLRPEDMGLVQVRLGQDAPPYVITNCDHENVLSSYICAPKLGAKTSRADETERVVVPRAAWGLIDAAAGHAFEEAVEGLCEWLMIMRFEGTFAWWDMGNPRAWLPLRVSPTMRRRLAPPKDSDWCLFVCCDCTSPYWSKVACISMDADDEEELAWSIVCTADDLHGKKMPQG